MKARTEYASAAKFNCLDVKEQKRVICGFNFFRRPPKCAKVGLAGFALPNGWWKYALQQQQRHPEGQSAGNAAQIAARKRAVCMWMKYFGAN